MKHTPGLKYPLPWIVALVFGSLAWASPTEAQVQLDALRTGETSIESVRSAYTAGRNKEAVVLADQALAELGNSEAVGAAQAELHFWRGASLRRLNRHEEAVVALDTAQRLGLRIPELYLERGLSRRALKQEQGAEKDYQEAERLIPPEDDRRFRFAERWKREMKEEPAFQLSVTPQVGYDSNIFGLERDAALVDPDLAERSLYYGLVLAAKYYLVRNDKQLLALEYRNQARAYSEEQEFNYTDNVIAGVGRQPFLEWADIEIRGSLGEAFSDGEGHLRTTRTVAPALLFYLSPSLQARLWGDWTDVDYYISDIPNEQDRDGVITRAGLVFGVDLGQGWSIAPHVGIANYAADGDDYDHQDWVAGIALTTPEFLGCVFSPSVSYTRASYEHENSVVGFTEEREDRIWRFAVTVTVRELERFIGYAPSLTIAFLDHSSVSVR
jgi:hypothetical protein